MIAEKVLSIDLGSSKMRAVLANITRKGEKRVLAAVSVESQGIKGDIKNPQAVSERLRELLSKLRSEAGTLPKEAYVSVAGINTLFFRTSAKMEFPGMQKITNKEINNLKKKAIRELFRQKGYYLNKFEVIHIIPYAFHVDNHSNIQDPRGFTGTNMALEALVILASKNILKTLRGIFWSAGEIKLKQGILQNLGALYGTRTPDSYYDKALFIYMGACSTEAFVMMDNKPILHRHVAAGGDDIIDDIQRYLKVNRSEAERLYYTYARGYVNKKNADLEKTIRVNYGTREANISEIVISILAHLRLKKIFQELVAGINSDLEDAKFWDMLNKVYITGGVANLKGVETLAEKIFKTPAMSIKQTNVKEIPDVTFSTALGIVDYVATLKNREKKITDLKEDIVNSYESFFFLDLFKKLLRDFI